jgi:hypothetical protein
MLELTLSKLILRVMLIFLDEPELEERLFEDLEALGLTEDAE